MTQEHIYIGIRREGGWLIYPAETITDAHLKRVDVLRDLQSTLVVGEDRKAARAQIEQQVALGQDPFWALNLPCHTCGGIELARAHVQRFFDAAAASITASAPGQSRKASAT